LPKAVTAVSERSHGLLVLADPAAQPAVQSARPSIPAAAVTAAASPGVVTGAVLDLRQAQPLMAITLPAMGLLARLLQLAAGLAATHPIAAVLHR